MHKDSMNLTNNKHSFKLENNSKNLIKNTSSNKSYFYRKQEISNENNSRDEDEEEDEQAPNSKPQDAKSKTTSANSSSPGTAPTPTSGPKISANTKGWMSITSVTLANPDYFPDLNTPNGTQKVFYDHNFTRLNPEFKVGDTSIPYPTAFYFKLNKKYLYYFARKGSKQILATMNLSSFRQASLQIKNTSCFNVVDYKENKWVFCAEKDEDALKFICKIQSTLKFEMERSCGSKSEVKGLKQRFEIKKINQPLIIIPLPSKVCNSAWDYSKNGDNWECLCKEGKEQSPVNLPPKKDAVDSALKPNFEYLIVDKEIQASDAQINIVKGDILKVRYENQAIKILHPNMGRVVTPDGSVYQAKEIIFHSPSEHMINNKRVDLEMQVVHYGITKGDIAKQLVLSLLFTSSPGSLNKFFDKINVYDLPNPLDKFREIHESLFIPYVFFKSEDEDMNIMKPFSFYTYKGSLTVPPCNEEVIYYVASDPIPLSNTSVTLMKEALRIPDKIDSKGNLQIDNNVYENFRNMQPLNGRAVFHYDQSKFDCPEIASVGQSSKIVNKSGHYEKMTKDSVRYFYVPGYEPSGLPNSILVTEDEANNNM